MFFAIQQIGRLPLCILLCIPLILLMPVLAQSVLVGLMQGKRLLLMPLTLQQVL
jgi:hypothetical protein